MRKAHRRQPSTKGIVMANRLPMPFCGTYTVNKKLAIHTNAINAPSWRAKALSCTTSSIRIINKNMCIIKRMQSYSKGMVKQNKMKHIFGGQRVKDV